MKVIKSGRQIERQLIIFGRTCTPAILFWEYTYSGPSNFGRFGQIFWRILLPYSRYRKPWLHIKRQNNKNLRFSRNTTI